MIDVGLILLLILFFALVSLFILSIINTIWDDCVVCWLDLFEDVIITWKEKRFNKGKYKFKFDDVIVEKSTGKRYVVYGISAEIFMSEYDLSLLHSTLYGHVRKYGCMSINRRCKIYKKTLSERIRSMRI